jgi:hypothetical protein
VNPKEQCMMCFATVFTKRLLTLTPFKRLLVRATSTSTTKLCAVLGARWLAGKSHCCCANKHQIADLSSTYKISRTMRTRNCLHERSLSSGISRTSSFPSPCYCTTRCMLPLRKIPTYPPTPCTVCPSLPSPPTVCRVHVIFLIERTKQNRREERNGK